ncbi:hypothetical protein ABEB36_002494 [Hypothenemus hampei]|uniref:Centrosomal and chromosomal factor n=1 Tax=Hypothenemus hampei TaxID=57062 RepID=A0ABD1F5Y2_HYPHA
MSGKSISYPHQQTARRTEQSADRQPHQSRTDGYLVNTSVMATCYPVSYELASPGQRTVPNVQKDYSRPLHVDCSVEYELPNAAKPPQGVRNEPLLMIHPCYFRKIESQRRSPFINNLPARPATALKRRGAPRGQQLPQQVPVQAAPYPVQYQTPQERSIWDTQVAPSQSYCKRDVLVSACAAYAAVTSRDATSLWTEPNCSPERPDDKHIMAGKYRQYLRSHRLHPYPSSGGIPLASTFPHQIQQVCYNV